MMFTCSEDGTILLLLRAFWVDQGGTWGIPGGGVEEGWFETPIEDPITDESVFIDAAMREAEEECGSLPPGFSSKQIIGRTVYEDCGFQYVTLIADLTLEQKESWNLASYDGETDEFLWVPRADVLPGANIDGHRLHFGVEFTISNMPSPVLSERKIRRRIRESLLLEGEGEVELYRAIAGDLVVSPDEAFSLDDWAKAFRDCLKIGTNETGEALIKIRHSVTDQFFADSLEGAQIYSSDLARRGRSVTIYRVSVSPELAVQGSARAAASNLTARGMSTNVLLSPQELVAAAQAGKLAVVSGPGKVIVASSEAALRAILRTFTWKKILSGIKSVALPTMIGDIAGTIAGPYIISIITGKPVEEINDLADVGGEAAWGFVKGLMPGGDSPVESGKRAAYEKWREQQVRDGKKVPTYDEMKAMEIARATVR